MYLPFVPVFLTSQLVVAVADGVPTIDIQATCRAAAAVTQGTSTQSDIDICVASEQKAREQLIKDWAQYAAADKSRCVQSGPKVYLPSYIEWLTCLEMEMAVRKMKLEEKTPAASPTLREREVSPGPTRGGGVQERTPAASPTLRQR